ncbi:hypothetical protein A8B84_02815 [Marinobacter sp. EhC06]|jgi:hypothetical protein|uniref:MarR family transcriptional regulator n=1 Tax=Marinobacter shengliensis TaxID=1389223 RepID=A0ABV4WAE5_9GAMM|nr:MULTISPECIES: hypothetical protein [unclassified Marinobacter]OAN93502.1 hypothetical protein A8B84_02815 [Marinobacter sp. EhC06]OAN94901.1 hypothetical protein A8B80_15395 [Marinobacter sp. EhN04]
MKILNAESLKLFYEFMSREQGKGDSSNSRYEKIEQFFIRYIDQRFQNRIRGCAEKVGLTPPEAQLVVVIGDEGGLSLKAIHKKTLLCLDVAEIATNRLITRQLVFAKRCGHEQTPRFYLSDEGAVVRQRLREGCVFPY